MQSEMTGELVSRAKALLADKTVQLVLGWRRGLFDYDVTPSLFTSADDVEKNFVYNEYSAANLSKYLVKKTRKIETAKNTVRANNAFAKQKTHRLRRTYRRRRRRPGFRALRRSCKARSDDGRRALCILAKRTFALYPLQCVPRRLSRLYLYDVRIRQPRIRRCTKSRRIEFRREHVPYHPRVARCRPLYRLRRMLARVSPAYPAAPHQSKIY